MLTIKKRLPVREAYLVAGVIATIGVAGALAAVVSAYSLKDQSAFLPTKVIKADDHSIDEPVAEEATRASVEEYGSSASSLGQPVTRQSVASAAPTLSSAVSSSPTSVPTVSVSPEPTPEEPTPSPEPELTPEP